ncbi:MFS transporter [Paraburkholderia acidicola]|uniref:MFS transporter n=1 Tax=Paraburkholderia acidicola TaxID=1912599 RepID=A0A2A4EPK6_9BURK|nr:MFS transporter [Paraburkholderia acidicola]PCE22340.1 MFS transporter [Paraburkholderia acidicola]
MNSPVSIAPAALRAELPKSSVARLSLAYAVATNGMILTPFLVAAVMLRFHLSEGIATQVAGVEILGVALSCALLPRWISRAAGFFTIAGVLGTIAGQVLSIVAPTVLLIGIVRGVTGIFEGVLFVVVASGISQRASADRLWGQINVIAGIINGGILVVISYLPSAWLGQGVFMLLVGVCIVMAPAIHGIGEFARHVTQARSRNKLPLKLVLTIWAVTVLIYGVQASQWAVAGIVGAHAGLSTWTVGILLSLSSLLGFAGAVIPSQRSSRQHRLAIIFVAQMVMIGSLVWFFGSTGNKSYFLSQLALNCAFFAIIPFLTGLLSEVDPDGSLVARTVVVTFVGGGVGTAVAGDLFTQYGGMHFAYVLCIGVAAAVPFVWLALRGATAHNMQTGGHQLS